MAQQKASGNRTVARAKVVGALIVVVTFLVAACGSSGSKSTAGGSSTTGSSTSAGVAAARAAVAVAEKAPSGFRAPGPSLDATTKLRGKSIWYIAPLAIPLAAYFKSGLTQALGLAGISVHSCDGQAEVSPTARCFSEAVAAHASLILTANVEPPALTGPISAAYAHHIPVIAVEEGEPGDVPPSSWPKGVVALLNQCHACAGKLMADAAIVESNGHADVLVLWSSGVIRIGLPQVNAIKAEFSKNCKACKVKVVDVPIPQWATELGSVTKTSMASDPNLNYLLPLYDGMAPLIVPAVDGAGKQATVKLVSFNATPSVMQNIASHNVVIADVGSNALEWGWYWADEVFRVLLGLPPALNEAPPQRIFTGGNIGSINLSASQTNWYGPTSYIAGFKKLWGFG